MKNILLSFVFGVSLCVLTFSSVAMDLKQSGIKGGINWANLTGEDTENTDTATLYTVGGFAVLNLSSKTKLRPEVLYTKKGYDANFLGMSFDARLTYLEIPILFQHNLPSRNRDNVANVFIGPALGFLLSAKAAGIDVKNQTESTEVSLHFGGGTTINRKFTMDVRYSLGLTSIAHGTSDVKTTGIMATMGYLF